MLGVLFVGDMASKCWCRQGHATYTQLKRASQHTGAASVARAATWETG